VLVQIHGRGDHHEPKHTEISRQTQITCQLVGDGLTSERRTVPRGRPMVFVLEAVTRSLQTTKILRLAAISASYFALGLTSTKGDFTVTVTHCYLMKDRDQEIDPAHQSSTINHCIAGSKLQSLFESSKIRKDPTLRRRPSISGFRRCKNPPRSVR
jgi:hypothetical protein